MNPDRGVRELAVIGTGFGGVGAGIMARREGIESMVILERSRAVGGTWRDNTYPGCACDIPANLYSFSFALEPGWSRTYPAQPEIEAYLERVVDEHDLRRSITFGFDVASLRWDDDRDLWVITSTDGRVVEASTVVSATGPLSQPSKPDIEGLGSFDGPVFHSAQWRHDVDLAGRRVAVVGTGASAIQIVPEIADRASGLVVFQRTPPWVLPRDDRPNPNWRRRLYARLPFLQRLHRWRVYVRQELLVGAFIGSGPVAVRMRDRVRSEVRAQIDASFPDPRAADALTPDHEPGCKRILISNDWYPTLARPDVRVVSEPIDRIEPEGIVTADGTLHRVDALVLATGFAVSTFPAPMEVTGREGIGLREHWSTGARSDLGLSVSGFPNLWFLIGPGTGLGHNSMVFMIEAQLRTVRGALRHLRAQGGGTLELRPEVEDASYARQRQRASSTVWASGCTSWYRDDEGRVDAIWPGTTIEYWWRTRRFRPDRYRASGSHRSGSGSGRPGYRPPTGVR